MINIKHQPNFSRSENILILPHNTLRVPDAMFMLKIYAHYKNKLPNFEENLYKCLSRKEKDLSKIFKIPKELKDDFKNNWAYYYDIAPRTNIYEYINIISYQKFVEKVTILFHDNKATDKAFPNDYYDGTIESLEKYISDNKITAIVLDDLDLLFEISNRKKISIENLSFFISKVGYNYEYNEDLDALLVKSKLHEIEKKFFIEVAMLNLFNFPESLIKGINKGENKI